VPVTTTAHDDNPLNVPVWLVALLGLLTMLGLGGAQTRMLGLWGPPPPLRPDARDARLLALQRAAQLGAASQQRIAALKKHVKDQKQIRDRTPVG
jgi:hypothetical protein